MSGFFESHEWASDLNGKKDSLNDFYNHYLEKADLKLNSPVVRPGSLRFSSNANNILFVIDMQNDFVLPNPSIDDRPDGAFSVADGEKMAGPLLQFINKNHQHFSKIILSRDTHPEDHCSFNTQEGIFPPHCVMNKPGAEFYPGYEGLKVLGEKVDVIFKGMASNADSYGAVKYGDSAYYSKRYSGEKCCNSNLDESGSGSGGCMDLTGGKYLKDKTKNFEKRIENEFGNDFNLTNILEAKQNEDDGDRTINIFVVGLAGDYCCRDTAINVALQGKQLQGKTINVYVIEEFVRYAFLPCPLTQISDKIQNRTDGDFSNYIFENNGDGYRILSKEEVEKLIPLKEPAEKQELDTSILKTSYNYSNFLTDPKDIVADYEKYGVQMLMKAPVFMTVGGKHTRRRRRRNTRKDKKSHKKRQNRTKYRKTRRINK